MSARNSVQTRVGRARRSSGKGPEAATQALILDYLAAIHVKAFRMNTGQMTSVHESTGKRRVTRFGVKGMADILAFPEVGGRPFPLWIEVKSAHGESSPFQESFARDVRSSGHKYILVRSIEDVIDALARLNLSITAATTAAQAIASREEETNAERSSPHGGC